MNILIKDRDAWRKKCAIAIKNIHGEIERDLSDYQLAP